MSTSEAKDIRIVFMGTPGFAVGVLDAMVNAGLQVVGVITAPDRPAGRGRKLRPSAVKEYAVSHQLAVLQPVNLKDPDFLKSLENWRPDLQVVVAFRMLPKAVWQLPRLGTFNLHASLLPQYRGAAPINWALMNGETETGVTTFFIDNQIDTGDVLLQARVPIAREDDAGSLHDTLMEKGSALVLETIEGLATQKIAPRPQPAGKQLKAAPKLVQENTRIDWSQPAQAIVDMVRGLSPYPVAWTELQQGEDKMKVKLYKVREHSGSCTEAPGTIRADKQQLKIASGNGWVQVDTLQVPGKRTMDIRSFLNGFSFTEDAKMV